MDDNTGGSAFPWQVNDGDKIKGSKGMTLRQYAAIMLRVPDSGDAGFDAMIRAARRMDFAAKAMQGVIQYSATKGIYTPPDKELASAAYDLADAMLKARGQ